MLFESTVTASVRRTPKIYACSFFSGASLVQACGKRQKCTEAAGESGKVTYSTAATQPNPTQLSSCVTSLHKIDEPFIQYVLVLYCTCVPQELIIVRQFTDARAMLRPLGCHFNYYSVLLPCASQADCTLDTRSIYFSMELSARLTVTATDIFFS